MTDISVRRTGQPTPVVPVASRVAETPTPKSIRKLVGVEELILQLTPRLHEFDHDVMNLCLPTESTRRLLAPTAEFWNLDASDVSQPTDSGRSRESVLADAASLGPVVRVADDPTRLADVDNSWQALFSQLDFFEHASFSIVRGEFASDDWSEFRTEVAFSGLAHRITGTWLDVRAQLELMWRRDDNSAARSEQDSAWRIVKFQPRSMELAEARATDVRRSVGRASDGRRVVSNPARVGTL